MVETGLHGKVAIVTGANHGIGAATAYALAAEGVAVLINYLSIPVQAGADTASTTPGIDFYHTRRSAGAEVMLTIFWPRGRHVGLQVR